MISCELCSNEFKDNYALSKHFKANHVCKFCNKQYKDKETMKSHREHCSKREGVNKICTHQLVNNRFSKSNYYVKAVESDKHGKNLLKGVLHVNSYNL